LAGLGAFAVLAVPLGLTLSQVSREAGLRKTARAAIAKATDGANSRIAQLT
jgi:cell envelope opacity-associated protein A